MGGQSLKEIEVIHSWSAPRSLSASLMYSFAQRNDTEVLDNPLYANFLKLTGADRPYRKEILSQMEITYRPQGADGVMKDLNMSAVVTIGFVKDAKHHIDIQGFNVYHKNRLIKPLWRLWNAAGSDGRGVIGVLEANFVEPAHDKQGFKCTTVLARLEARLLQMQKTYCFVVYVIKL